MENMSEISEIQIDDPQNMCRVGKNGITCIEAFEKSGLASNIPYARVWKGDEPIAEFCQHQIVGVYFKVQS